jgi:hypothetical protein
MATSPTDESQICPACGAHAMSGVERCWKCGANLTGPPVKSGSHRANGRGYSPPVVGGDRGGDAEPILATPAQSRVVFGLPFLFVATAFAAVLATIIVYAPRMGAALAIVATPVALRTTWVVLDNRYAGRRLTLGTFAQTVAFSFVVAGLAILAGTAVFGVVYFVLWWVFSGVAGGPDATQLVVTWVAAVAAICMAATVVFKLRDLGD